MKKILAIVIRSILAVRKFLAGHKTYFLVSLSILYSLGIQRGWWQGDQLIWTSLGSGVALTVRAACVRLIKQFLDDMTKASATPPP